MSQHTDDLKAAGAYLLEAIRILKRLPGEEEDLLLDEARTVRRRVRMLALKREQQQREREG